MPELNIELLTATNDHIRKYPDLHNQGIWAEGPALRSEGPLVGPLETEADLRAGAVCGTAFCFAGWASILGGWHQCRGEDTAEVVDEVGRTVGMATAARLSLGLTGVQCDYLFSGTNSQELIDRFVSLLVAHPDADRADLNDVFVDYMREIDY
jgi:hypothetical protein